MIITSATPQIWGGGGFLSKTSEGVQVLYRNDIKFEFDDLRTAESLTNNWVEEDDLITCNNNTHK